MHGILSLHTVFGTAISLILAGGSSAHAAIAGPPNEPAPSPGEAPTLHATPKVIADVSELVPGQTARLLISFDIKPHWHMYWNGQNDTGQPPTWKPVDWPEGFTLGHAGWPAPTRTILPGDIRDHIYEGQFGVVVELNVPTTMKPGTSVKLPLHLEWMVCERMCVLEEQEISITLPVGKSGALAAQGEGAKQVEAARKRIPRGAPLAAEPASRAKASLTGGTLTIRVPGAAEMEFFPGVPGAEPKDPISGTTAKGQELSVALAGPMPGQKAAGIVAWRAAGQSSWEYDWVDVPAKAAADQGETIPTPSAPAQ